MRLLFLFFLLLASGVASAFSVGFDPAGQIFYDQSTIFSARYSCETLLDSPYLKPGDLFEYFVSACVGSSCKVVSSSVELYRSGCDENVSFDFFVPPSSLADGFSLVFVAHRLDDPVAGGFPIHFVKRFEVVKPILLAESTGAQPIALQPVGLFDIFFISGLLLVALSLVLLKWGHWWGFIVFALGIAIIAYRLVAV